MMGAGNLFLLVLVAASWLLMLLCMTGFVGVNAHGDAIVGVAYSFFLSSLFLVLTWLLSGFLLIAASRLGLLTGMMGWICAILLPLSGAAALGASFLIATDKLVWPVAVPVCLPILMAAYVVHLYVPSARASAFGTNVGTAIWGAILLLTLLPCPGLVSRWYRHYKNMGPMGPEERVERALRMEAERMRPERLEKIRKMTGNEHISAWVDLLLPTHGTHSEAIEALRHSPSRQADMEKMLPYGIQIYMMIVPELDLQPTPELCQGARMFLRKRAQSLHSGANNNPQPFRLSEWHTEILPGIRWFVGHGCECAQEITALEEAAKAYPDTADRRKYLAMLEEIRNQAVTLHSPIGGR
jgi:hypothetical protein